jgi:hypothetical protein
MRHLIICIFILSLLSSCGPSISRSISQYHPPLDQNEPVEILGLDDTVPDNALTIGSVKLDDTGFSMNCGWDVVITKATDEARSMGGNILKITNHKRPDFWSTCHRISALVLKLDSLDMSQKAKTNESEDNFHAALESALTGQQTETQLQPESKTKIVDYPVFRLGLNGSWSYRLASIHPDTPSDFKQYTRELKSGFSYGADAIYYWSDRSGIGVKYSKFFSSNSIGSIYVDDPYGNRQYGKLSDDLAITFIGPVYSVRSLVTKNNNYLVLNAGLGYVGYKNDFVLISPGLTKGSTLGLCYEFNYDIMLSESTALGLHIAYYSGLITKRTLTYNGQTEVQTLSKDNYEGLARLEVGIGLRFWK